MINMHEVNFFIDSLDITQLFQTALVPIVMFSGIGLFLLIVQTRYGRIVDRIRIINNERLGLIKDDIFKEVTKIEKKWNTYRLQGLQQQVSILILRGKLLKNALQLMFLAIFTSILSSTLLFIEQIAGISVSTIVVLLFATGMIMLFIACLYILREVTQSYSAVMYDIDTHVPKEYRIKTGFGIMGDLEKEE